MSGLEAAEQAKAKGNQYFAKQEWDKAIEEYNKAIEANPNGNGSHTYFSNRSACFAEQQKYEEALADAKQSVKLKPDFVKGYSRLGFAHFKLGDLDEAEKAYQEGLKVEANNESLKTGLEEVKKAKSKPSGGGGLFGPEIWMTIHQNPELRQYANDRDFVTKVNMLQQNPQMAMQAGLLNDPKIQKLFQHLLGAKFGGAPGDMPQDEHGDHDDHDHDHPHDHPHPHPHKHENKHQEDEEEDDDDDDEEHEHVHNEHCSHAHKTEDTKMKDKAKPKEEEKKKEEEEEVVDEEEKQRRIKQKENEALAFKHKEKGNEYYRDKKFDEAIEEYKKSAEYDPTKPAYILNISAVLFMQEKWDECIEYCQQAIDTQRKHHSDYSWSFKAYQRMGHVEEKRNNVNKAIEYYNKALLEKNDETLRKTVKKLKENLKKMEEQAYLNPELAVQHKEKGNDYFKNGKWEDAIYEYTESLKRNPNDAKTYNNRATAYCKVMRWDNALEDCDKALKLEPNFGKAYFRKGLINHCLKQYHRALECFHKAEEIDPNLPDLKKSKMDTLYAIQERNAQGDIDDTTRQQALSDPKVQAAMNDAEVSSVLLQAQTDSSILFKAMRDRPHIAKKIETLIAAGVLQLK